VEVTVPRSIHRHQFGPLSDLYPATTLNLHIGDGGMFYTGCSIGFFTFLKFFQLSIRD